MLYLARILRGAVTGLFVLILLPVAIDYFEKANPTASDYRTTFGAIMGVLISFAQLPWVYPMAFVLGGGTAGIWFDAIARRLSSFHLKSLLANMR